MVGALVFPVTRQFRSSSAPPPVAEIAPPVPPPNALALLARMMQLTSVTLLVLLSRMPPPFVRPFGPLPPHWLFSIEESNITSVELLTVIPPPSPVPLIPRLTPEAKLFATVHRHMTMVARFAIRTPPPLT